MSRSPSIGSERKGNSGGDDEPSFDALGASAVPVAHLLRSLGIEAGGGERATDSPGPEDHSPNQQRQSGVPNPESFLPIGTPNGLTFRTPTSLQPDDRQGRSGGADADDGERCNLYVSNISLDINDDDLRAIFVPYGTIVNSRIMVDIHTCKSRGFGFVQFSNATEAAVAVKAVDGSVHNSQTLMVRVASKKTRQPGALLPKVFLRNVPAGVSEDELRRICSCFGAITTCAVRPDVQHGVVTDAVSGGVSQVAYITFSEIDGAKQAAASLNNSRPWDACTHPLLAKVLDNNQKRRDKDEPGSAGVSPGLSSTHTSLHATPQFHSQLHGVVPYPPAAVVGPRVVGGVMINPQMTPTMPGMPGSASQSPYGLQPNAYSPNHQQVHLPHHHHHPHHQHHQQQHQQPPVFSGMPPFAGAQLGGMPSPYPMPGMGGGMPYPGMAPINYSPGGLHSIPPGYQVVMQPTLQPMYQPQPQQGPPGMVPHFSPNAFGPNGTPNPWQPPQQHQQFQPQPHASPPGMGGSPGLLPQPGR